MSNQALQEKIPPLMDGLKMVDAELRVYACSVDEIPEWIKEQFLADTPYDDINCITFFYHPGADAVVLNSSHKNADLYELLVTTYLNAEEDDREELKRKIPENVIGTAINLLDSVIKKRDECGKSNSGSGRPW